MSRRFGIILAIVAVFLSASVFALGLFIVPQADETYPKGIPKYPCPTFFNTTTLKFPIAVTSVSTGGETGYFITGYMSGEDGQGTWAIDFPLYGGLKTIVVDGGSRIVTGMLFQYPYPITEGNCFEIQAVLTVSSCPFGQGNIIPTSQLWGASGQVCRDSAGAYRQFVPTPTPKPTATSQPTKPPVVNNSTTTPKPPPPPPPPSTTSTAKPPPPPPPAGLSSVLNPQPTAKTSTSSSQTRVIPQATPTVAGGTAEDTSDTGFDRSDFVAEDGETSTSDVAQESGVKSFWNKYKAYLLAIGGLLLFIIGVAIFRSE